MTLRRFQTQRAPPLARLNTWSQNNTGGTSVVTNFADRFSYVVVASENWRGAAPPQGANTDASSSHAVF